MRLFVDLDGVMADFDAHYENTIAPLPDRWRTDYDHDANDEVDWAKIDKTQFYLSMPLMRDAMVLWDYALVNANLGVDAVAEIVLEMVQERFP